MISGTPLQTRAHRTVTNFKMAEDIMFVDMFSFKPSIRLVISIFKKCIPQVLNTKRALCELDWHEAMRLVLQTNLALRYGC